MAMPQIEQHVRLGERLNFMLLEKLQAKITCVINDYLEKNKEKEIALTEEGAAVIGDETKIDELIKQHGELDTLPILKGQYLEHHQDDMDSYFILSDIVFQAVPIDGKNCLFGAVIWTKYAHMHLH